MIRRAITLLSMLSFGSAWIVGVWCLHSPRVRLENALLAALIGALGGAAIGFALERIVLARMAEQWKLRQADGAPPSGGEPPATGDRPTAGEPKRARKR